MNEAGSCETLETFYRYTGKQHHVVKHVCRREQHWTGVIFEVLTAVVMKSSIFWDIKPYSPLKIN
jgi:hypothetical protein